MKRRPLVTILLLAILSFCGVLSWRFTRGNAGWQIQQVFPGAQVYFDPIGSPDLTLSQVIRIVIPNQFKEDESLGFNLYDCSEPLDLHQHFSRTSHLRLLSVHLTRCKITNLCSTSALGFPSVIVFDDCDFSQLPKDQRSQLRPYDPSDPTATKKFYVGGV